MRVLILLLLVALSGCKRDDESVQQYRARIMDTQCLDGVTYWIFNAGYHGFMAPRYNTDGSLVLCTLSKQDKE